MLHIIKTNKHTKNEEAELKAYVSHVNIQKVMKLSVIKIKTM